MSISDSNNLISNGLEMTTAIIIAISIRGIDLKNSLHLFSFIRIEDTIYLSKLKIIHPQSKERSIDREFESKIKLKAK